MTEAFVYCWTDHKSNKLYVGSHLGTVDDGYVCSSKPMMREYKKRPDDFTRQIVAHGTHEDCRKLEAKILDAVDAKMDESFYNMHNGNGDFYLKSHGPKAKAKISRGNKGKKRPDLAERNKTAVTPEQRSKAAKTRYARGHLNPMQGKNHAEESLTKMSESKKGAKNPMFGRKVSEEARARIAAAKKLYWQNKKALV